MRKWLRETFYELFLINPYTTGYRLFLSKINILHQDDNQTYFYETALDYW